MKSGWTSEVEPGGSTQKCFLPRDLLSKDFPQCRIISVGWKWLAGTPRWSQLANSLNSRLCDGELDEKAPIIFIAHGIGGVALKSAAQSVFSVTPLPPNAPPGALLPGVSAETTTRVPQLDRLDGFIFLGQATKRVFD